MPEDFDNRRLTQYPRNPNPGIGERIYNYFASDPGSALPSLGEITAPAAIALNETTLPIFRKAIKEASEKYGRNDVIQQIVAFLKTRYPRFTSQVPIRQATQEMLNEPNFMGAYERPIIGTPGRESIYINPNQTAEEMTNTIAHELTHARQFKKSGREVFDNVLHSLDIPYEQRPGEILAEQAGLTGQKNYDKMRALVFKEFTKNFRKQQ